jgi:hypothetical protein
MYQDKLYFDVIIQMIMLANCGNDGCYLHEVRPSTDYKD